MPYQNYLSIYAKSFNWAGFFLPKDIYQKCSVLYDFCRVADNIADDINSVDIKKNKFIKFKNNFNQKNFKDPIIENMWKLIDGMLTQERPSKIGAIKMYRRFIDCTLKEAKEMVDAREIKIKRGW